MHWLVTQISLLPWWAPAIAAVSLYWIPRFALWPLANDEWCSIFIYSGETCANMAYVPFYIVYILSRTVEQLAELALLAVMLVAIGVLAAIIMLIFAAFLDIGSPNKKKDKRDLDELKQKIQNSAQRTRLRLVNVKQKEG